MRLLSNFSKLGLSLFGFGLLCGGLVGMGMFMDMRGGDWLWIAMFASFVVFLVGYLMPTIIAAKAGHPSLVVIVLINIFTGWFLIGWFVAMFWAVQSVGAKRCPSCKEIVRKDATVCKHCQQPIDCE